MSYIEDAFNQVCEDAEPRKDHGEYLAAWIRRCKSDPRAIFNAASKAQAAVDFILAFGISAEKEKAA